jgi:predicted TIM-barrel fold metal-dependent hydrolase
MQFAAMAPALWGARESDAWRITPDMTALGAIDCDVHPTLPGMKVLLPFLDDYWQDHLIARGTDKLNLSMTSYPPNAPLSARPDWRESEGSTLAALQRDALDTFGSRFAICNVIYAAQALHSEDMSAVLCSAANDWLRQEWLDKDSRLRASIVVPLQSPELAVKEIERCAADQRFVQVLLLASSELPLGRRYHWPIYEAAQRLGLPVCIHAGGTYRHAPTPCGWPSYYVEDYVAQSQAFQSQVLSLIAEGVFKKFPDLRIVLAEAGFTWLPAFMWFVDKDWRGVRREVPWVTEPPSELIRRHVRLTLQPTDEPPTPAMMERLMEHIGSDEMLLFSTDYPHWQFEGDKALPAGLSPSLIKKITIDNPLATYARLREPQPQRQKEEAVS